MEFSHEDKKEIDRVIDCIGYTKYHIFLFIIIVLIGFADGIEIVVLNLIMKSFEDEWALIKFEKGVIVSSAFIGIFIGSLSISKYMDIFGRKPFIIYGVILTVIFGYLSCTANSFYELSIYRLLMGIGIGSKMTSSFTLVTESLPNHQRSIFLSATLVSFPLGSIYVCIIGMNIMPNFEPKKWRDLLFYCVLPSVLCFFLVFFIIESVRFLFANEKYTEAKQNLYQLSKYGNYNLKEEEVEKIISETKTSRINKYESNFEVLFADKFRSITINLSIIWFIVMSNFSISNYLLPLILFHVFGKLALQGNLFKSVLITSILSLPGPLVAGYITNMPSLGRIKTMSYSFILGVFFTSLIIINPSNVIFWDCIMKMAIGCGFNAMRIYLSEAYPTKIRAIGNGFGNSIGKIANIIAPFLCELLMSLFGIYTPYYFIIFTTTIAIFNAYSLPFETLGRSLDESNDENKIIEFDESNLETRKLV